MIHWIIMQKKYKAKEQEIQINVSSVKKAMRKFLIPYHTLILKKKNT